MGQTLAKAIKTSLVKSAFAGLQICYARSVSRNEAGIGRQPHRLFTIKNHRLVGSLKHEGFQENLTQKRRRS